MLIKFKFKNNLFVVKEKKSLENNFIHFAMGTQHIEHMCVKKFEQKLNK